MELNVPALSMPERYKLLVGLVFPRPIALISTRNENGIANCAPFSYFNAVCEDPMLVVLSFNRRSDGRMKHSLANLLRTGEFVVNLVDENIANGMHVSRGEFADDVGEFDQANFRGRLSSGRTALRQSLLHHATALRTARHLARGLIRGG